jgi:hypothetical protein
MKENDEILTKLTNDKIINFSASRYRLKIIINDINSVFLILFQGFMTGLTNNTNKDEFDKLPNYIGKNIYEQYKL